MEVHRLHVAIPTRDHLERLPKPEVKPLLTVPDLCRYLGGSRQFWYALGREGVLPTIWVGHRVFIPSRELRAAWTGAVDGASAA